MKIHQIVRWTKIPRSNIFLRFLLYFAVLLSIVILQVYSAWNYRGDKVDESEMVLFAVGFLGGDLNPTWDGYGHFGMYLLGLVYYVDGLLNLLLGQSNSLVEYASNALGSGRFYILGRLTFAILLALSASIAASIIFKVRRQKLLAYIFFIVLCFSPSIVIYANYIRSDTLVAFFTIAALYYSSHEEAENYLFALSFCISAAIACKISALSLLVYLSFVLFLLYRSKKVSLTKALIVLISSPIFIIFLSPFMDYVGLLKTIVSSEINGNAVNLVRIEYNSIGARFHKILEFHRHSIGVLPCLLACLSVLGLLTDFRKITLLVWALIVVTIGPYLLGHTIREYWFIPSYILVSMLAAICVAAILTIIEDRSSIFRYRSTYPAVLILLASYPVYIVTHNHFSTFNIQLRADVSNKELSRQWLYENHLGSTPILLDKHFFWIYPQLYDPVYLGISRSVSRIFTYERAGSKFLSRVLEHDLYPNTNDDGEKTVALNIELKNLRVDFEGEVTNFGHAAICSYYSSKCQKLRLLSMHDMSLSNSNEVLNSVVQEGPDPFAVFAVNRVYSGDGGHYLKLSTDARRLQLFYDTGDDFTVENQEYFRAGSGKYTIRYIKRDPWVNLIAVNERPSDKVNIKSKVLFVTSPSGYGRFQAIVEAQKTGPKADAAKVFIKRYSEITKSKPIKIFDSGVGPAIEIYELPQSVLSL